MEKPYVVLDVMFLLLAAVYDAMSAKMTAKFCSYRTYTCTVRSPASAVKKWVSERYLVALWHQPNPLSLCSAAMNEIWREGRSREGVKSESTSVIVLRQPGDLPSRCGASRHED